MKEFLLMIKDKIMNNEQIRKHVLPIIYVIVGITIIVILLMNFTNVFHRSFISKQVDYYYYTWIEFQRIGSVDLHKKWHTKYHNVVYEMNGDAKYNKYDCTSSVFWFLKDLDSNFPLLKVEELFKTLTRMSVKRQTIREVKPKDLIVIYVDYAWHIGIIEKVFDDGFIRYIDVNRLSRGVGYKEISFNSPLIRGIFPIPFELWIGDLLKEVKELNNSR